MKRLTYQTVGDAQHPQHYCPGYGVKKDDLVQRLGFIEDMIERVCRVLRNEQNPMEALMRIEDIYEEIEEVCEDV